VSGPIKEAMQALNRHSDVVERALGGVVSADGEVSKASISGLRQASALRAAGQDGFRLHPRLRDYLYDHLQLFPAYQSLTEVGSRIGQLQALWAEVDAALKDSDRETLASLSESLTSVIYDIADGIDRNLQFLSTLLTTKYGNVRSLAAKVSQNRFYQHQSVGLANDLNRLERVANTIEIEAEARRMHELARLLRRVILEKSMLWQHGLSDMQTVIRRELFRTREVQQSLKHLARADVFLRQQPAWRGFEPELPERIPDFLLRASLPRLVAHAEPLDGDRLVRDELAGLVRAMPPRKVAPAEDQAPQRYKRVVDEPSEEDDNSPLALALAELQAQVLATAGGVALLQWQGANAACAELEEGVWLVFAVVALRGRGLHVDLLLNTPRPGERFAQTFYNAVAYAIDPLGGAAAANTAPGAIEP
jgi:hypothetical protein